MIERLRKNYKGDTIVEVLIAITVASSVLGVSLSTMNRNLSITRDNQERTEASKYAQGQIEALKAIVDQGITPPAVGKSFCLSSNGTTVTVLSDGNPPRTTPEADDFATYGICKSADDLYHYVITHDAPKSFRVYVRWDALRGQPRHQVIMAYRI